ncbi:MAG: bifunctional nuclease family protein [Bacillota bacterium]|nr:bifunctional nuclease family protein [Bacillota bacterium]HHU60887.1 bifunctional nuclease family protein [Natronincola sp.]
MLRMKVKVVGVDRETMLPVVILTDEEERSYVPLVIGPAEANAIAIVLENVEVSRPLTHDLFLNSILALGAKVDRVELTDLTDDVYYAELHLIQSGKTLRIDARPSDAIALALRSGAPIYVDDKVVAHAITVPRDDDDEMEQFRSFLENLSPDDFRKEN